MIEISVLRLSCYKVRGKCYGLPARRSFSVGRASLRSHSLLSWASARPLCIPAPPSRLYYVGRAGRCFMHGMGGRLCRVQTLRLALAPYVAPCFRLRLHTSPLAPLPPRCLVVWGSLDVLDRMDRINVLRLICSLASSLLLRWRSAVTRSAMREFPI